MYRIQSYGYHGSSEVFSNITKARKALNEQKKEDRIACRARFKSAPVSATKDSYKISNGVSLYSAASIVPC
jgi:hypothetical protein